MASFNQYVFQFIHQLAGRSVLLDDLVVLIAQYLAYGMVAAFLVLVYYEDGWRKKLYVFIEGAIAVMLARGLITEAIRFFYHRERPFSFYNFAPLINESGWSFPSGHAAWFFALSLTIWYVNRKWGYWFFALSLVMGLARVFAGVHWPLDILGGMVVGLVSAWVVHSLLSASRKGLYAQTSHSANPV